ncbi:hypothetical protein P280DRAFT_480248 [Massarina eburnea CBS 473.64]|uniref:Polycomb protein VEFS-Box domain-containing protein n=1 Tax=Massarina eburnea CBS 473.64 TaxID=1395130 RepID=A0A6A6RYV4_9PLEO|nr:hypothetical protein P280DRAFT_480248 [Massarina eburnea CBS 473.64]
MVPRQDALLGNSIFYDYVLSKRNPTFLHRNLIQALRSHQQELETLESSGSGSGSNQSKSLPPARHNWKMPSSESLKSLVNQAQEMEAFVLEIMDNSILAAYNRQTLGRVGRSYLPTPPADNYELTFIYSDRTITHHDLVCPLDHCTNQRFATIDEIRMHLNMCHENLRYTPKNVSNADGVQKWKFTCENEIYRADNLRASNAAPDPRDIILLAPTNPFNQEKYLAGNIDFQKAARLEKTAIPRTKSRLRPRRPPYKVLERVQPERKVTVPKAPPGVSFFRTLTKRPIFEGEYLSESDNEVDMGWLEMKKQYALCKAGVGKTTERFLAVFDPFIKQERLEGDRHIGDAVLRFTRAKAALLWQHQTMEEFKVKLDQLLSDHLVSEDIHVACLQTLEKNKPSAFPTKYKHDFSKSLATLDAKRSQTSLIAAQAGNGKSKDKRDRKGKAKVVSESGQLTPQTVDSEGDVEMRGPHINPIAAEETNELPPYDLCLCGEDAISCNRLFVVCDGLDCVRHAFHIDCIVKHWRLSQPPNRTDPWTCKECEELKDGEATVMVHDQPGSRAKG